MADSAGQFGTKGSWVSGFNSLSILRQLGLMVGLAASIAIGFAVVLWSQAPDYRVLFSNLTFADANEVIEQLDQLQIPYEFDTAGRAILVPQDQVHQARLRLAAQGFTNDKTVGFELLDQDQGLGTSQFMETARFRRGLEGELARTVASMVAVRNARVHLAIPKDSVFIRDSRKPRASVFVEMFSGRKLERDQVAAIANLVASSIPELDVKDVTVVDQKGRLLNTRDADTDVVLAAKQLEYTRSVEDTLLNRVNSILQPVVGLGNFRAEVSADVDFTQIEQADEMYNPDLPALRSEKSLEEKRAAGDSVGGVPGALSNQPPGPSSVPEQIDGAAGAGAGVNSGVAGSSREQTVKNYELDRSVSYTKHQQGRIQRISVAVVVDDLMSVNPADGSPMRSQWQQNELERLKVLVENAVGYSAARGDSVTVVNSPFVPPEQVQDVELSFWQQEWFWDLGKQLMAALFVLILVLFVLRPILRSLANSGSEKSESSHLGPAGDVSAELEGLEGTDVADDKVTFGNIDKSMMATPNESFEYQLNAIRSLVAEDPEKVAQAVRQWVIDRE